MSGSEEFARNIVRALRDAGQLDSRIKFVADDPGLLEMVLLMMKRRIELPSLFLSGREVLQAVRRRARKRQWPISNEQWNELALTAPEPSTDFLVGPSLDLWLGDTTRTMDELLLWLEEAKGLYRSPSLDVSKSYLRLLAPEAYPPRESLVLWTEIDFGANWDAADGMSAEGRDPLSSAGFDLLVALAAHDYMAHMDGLLVPGCRVGAFESRLQDGTWGGVPVISKVGTLAQPCWVGHSAADRSRGFSTPVRKFL